MKGLVLLLAAATAGLASAATENIDRDVGTCYAYMLRTGRMKGADDVSKMAVNGRAAEQYAKIALREGLQLSQGDSCRNLGIYPSDYDKAAKGEPNGAGNANLPKPGKGEWGPSDKRGKK